MAGGPHRGAASGWNAGSRGPNPEAPIRRSTGRRSAPAAARGSASVTSTPRTASASSSRDGRFAGEVSLGSVQRGPFQMAYVGYWIDEALAGTGTYPKASCCSCATRSRRWGCTGSKRPSCRATRPSRRVAEKLGLRDEGIALGFLQIQGVFEDHVRYAMTVEEWEAHGHELVAHYLA